MTNAKRVKARTKHLCCFCKKVLEIGEDCIMAGFGWMYHEDCYFKRFPERKTWKNLKRIGVY